MVARVGRMARPEIPRRRGPGRPRTNLSLETILDAAIEVLDAEGADGLTFRGLAGQLETGVGSLYWYVSGKEELLVRAADMVVARAVDEAQAATGDSDYARQAQYPRRPRIPRTATPAERTRDEAVHNLRIIAIAFFRELVQHSWVAEQLGRRLDLQTQTMVLLELMGQQLLLLDLTPRQRFDAVSAIINYITGVGSDIADHEHAVRAGADRESMMGEALDHWRATDEQQFPFLHAMILEFADHDDTEQMVAGLDLLLAGLRQQATPR